MSETLSKYEQTQQNNGNDPVASNGPTDDTVDSGLPQGSAPTVSRNGEFIYILSPDNGCTGILISSPSGPRGHRR